MRASLLLVLASLPCASPAAAFSTPVAAKGGPPIIPYLCSDNIVAELVYENGAGNRHARASLSFAGQHWEMHEAPSFSGLHYSATEGDHEINWSVTGENALISRAAVTGAGSSPQEIARCVRLRGGQPGAHAKSPAEAASH